MKRGSGIVAFLSLMVVMFSAAQDQEKKNLTIVIKDELGGGVLPNVKVALTPIGEGFFKDTQEKKSNHDGKLIFGSLKPGRYMVVIADIPEPEKFALEELPPIEITGDTDNEIKLGPSSSLSGKVTFDPNVVSSVVISASQVRGNRVVINKEVRVKQDGRYQITGLNGLLPVNVGVRSKETHAKGLLDVKLEPFKEKDGVNFEINPFNTSVISLRGTVRVNNQPSRNTIVLMSSVTPIGGFTVATVSGISQGEFTVYDLPAGEYTVRLDDVTGQGRVPEDYPVKTVLIEDGMTPTLDFSITTH